MLAHGETAPEPVILERRMFRLRARRFFRRARWSKVLRFSNWEKQRGFHGSGRSNLCHRIIVRKGRFRRFYWIQWLTIRESGINDVPSSNLLAASPSSWNPALSSRNDRWSSDVTAWKLSTIVRWVARWISATTADLSPSWRFNFDWFVEGSSRCRLLRIVFLTSSTSGRERI